MYSNAVNEVNHKIWNAENGKFIKEYKEYSGRLINKKPLFLNNGDIFIYIGRPILINIEKYTIKEQGKSMDDKDDYINTYKG